MPYKAPTGSPFPVDRKHVSAPYLFSPAPHCRLTGSTVPKNGNTTLVLCCALPGHTALCFTKLETGCGKVENIPDKIGHGTWVQTERAAHEAWMNLISKSPVAAQVMHALTARLGDHNAVVISQVALARIIGRSERAVRTAVKLLRDDNWIEVRQLGNAGTVNAYVVNDRVAWSGRRNGIRHSLFSATVIVSDAEQPDRESLGNQAALRRLPSLFPGEQQLPSGDGLPPPSEPALPGYEPDLPAKHERGADD